MSTDTKKLKIPKSKATPGQGSVSDRNGVFMASFQSEKMDWEEEGSMATLYAEAHNVYNQTGLSPLELVEKLRGFAEAVERLKKQVELCDYRDGLDHEFRMNAAYLDLITIQFQKP